MDETKGHAAMADRVVMEAGRGIGKETRESRVHLWHSELDKLFSTVNDKLGLLKNRLHTVTACDPDQIPVESIEDTDKQPPKSDLNIMVDETIANLKGVISRIERLTGAVEL